MRPGTLLIRLAPALAFMLPLAAGASIKGSKGFDRVPAARAAAAAASFASDRIELQLGPRAAQAARAMRAIEAARQGVVPSGAAATAAPDVVVPGLGVAAVDRAVAEFGAARFEPEFRGETPPPEGSPGTDF